tara:strand:- start:788 stop:1363 length:576 start_codon:yes stop_codon:yes gene_type:complete
MGLDMYLDGVFSKKAYFQEDRSVPMDDPVKSESLKLALASIDFPDSVPLDFSYRHFEVRLPIACWRKANQIHKYVVDNFGKGVDDQNSIYLANEHLKQILDVVKKVGNDPVKAEKLLPPTEGFFFGSQEIDEYYWQDLAYTKEVIEKTLAYQKEQARIYKEAELKEYQKDRKDRTFPDPKGFDSFRYRASW